jgi:adenylate kinase
MKLIILGIQGSGKGTQGKLIAEKYNLKHISTGDLLRKEVAEKSELGTEISSYIDKGNLVPDELINKIFLKNLPKDNYLLDGYPRNTSQAEFLENISKIDKVIFLELEEAEVFKRLEVRTQCNKCKIYYGLNNPPKKLGICNQCGEKIEVRKDDNPESIKKRINLFNKETLPIVNFYKDKVIKINGNQTVEEVFEDIIKTLG